MNTGDPIREGDEVRIVDPAPSPPPLDRIPMHLPWGPWRWLIMACVFVSALTLVLTTTLFLRGQQDDNRLEAITRTNRGLALDAEEQGEETRTALCALRADLERRIETSKQFLEENPQGIPGISAAVIQQGLDNQQQTVDALSNLACG